MKVMRDGESAGINRSGEGREFHIEDLASRDGPESCVGDPRGRSEALIGVRVGRAIEPRNASMSGCRRSSIMRKAMLLAALARAVQWTPRGRRTQACA
jgi:hypothetical protein